MWGVAITREAPNTDLAGYPALLIARWRPDTGYPTEFLCKHSNV
jgi:hypothetical protein